MLRNLSTIANSWFVEPDPLDGYIRTNMFHHTSRVNSAVETPLVIRHEAEYQAGRDLLDRLHGGQAGEQLVSSLQEICPDFATMTIEWALTGIMGRAGLDLVTREFLLIASCVTLGHAMPQLNAHIEAALKLGASKEQVLEVILQMLFYAGGAATSNALRSAQTVFDQKL
jgi:4-carboxymuconolactone decarboxylase